MESPPEAPCNATIGRYFHLFSGAFSKKGARGYGVTDQNLTFKRLMRSRLDGLRGLVYLSLFFSILFFGPPFSVSVSGQHDYFSIRGSDFLEQTQVIFLGKMIGLESFRSDSGQFILTRYTFQVEESITGAAEAERLEIVEYGGTLGEETVTVSHSPQYGLNQEYLVFCYVDPLRQNRTLGGSLGRLAVLQDQQGKRVARLYSSHPILQVLSAPKAQVLWEIGVLAGQLRSALQGSSHETD